MEAPESNSSQKRLSALLEVMTSMAAEHDLDLLLQKIMQATCEVMQADRCTLFLVDEGRQEIWSRVFHGTVPTEIRVPLGKGIAGHVAQCGETVNITDAYNDARFNPEVDRRTGYRTQTIICMPMCDRQRHVVGVLQVLNKFDGVFTKDDEEVLAAFSAQAAVALQNAILIEDIRKRMQTSDILLNVMRAVSSELEVDQLLQTIVAKTSEALNADRCTLFLVDRKTGELWSKVAQGMSMKEIRVPRGGGIAGHVALTGDTVNIPDAYQDSRFNPEVDRRTGYRTQSILCMPVRDDANEITAVLQVLNKAGGPFDRDDEQLLDALGSQTAIALKNSRLFEEVCYMKNYNEGILQTMATGVITLDQEGQVAFSNPAGLNLVFDLENFEVGQSFEKVFSAEFNPQFTAGIAQVMAGGDSFTAYDLQFHKQDGEPLKINANVLPLRDSKHKSMGSMIIIDDITQEQRLMSTLCRYMSRQVAEQVLKNKDELQLGGRRSSVAVLFCDIRNFTSISERSSAEEVVTMLNEYFSRMIEPIFYYEGTLDKYIGDAIMAVFGAPVPHENDGERAILAALGMRRALKDFNHYRLHHHGLAPIEIGIGITKGDAICGNIGGELRMDYTVIGDTVNIASRLEGLTKNHECKILVNHEIYLEVKDSIRCIDLGFAQVKGKEGEIQIYGIPDLAERRVDGRWQLQFELRYGVDAPTTLARGVDINERSIGFASDNNSPVGTEFIIQYRLNPKDHWVTARCILRRSQNGILGAEFLDLKPEDCDRIAELMKANRSKVKVRES